MLRAQLLIANDSGGLADAALAIRSFKVDVEYTYRLKREATVTVTPLKRPEAKEVPKEVPT